MNLNFDYENDVLCVAATGRLDIDTQADFEENILKNLQETGAQHLILDLSDTEYISSAGLKSLLMVASHCTKQAVRSAVCSLRPEVARVYRTTGFARVMNLYDTREDATSALLST